jgi:hypothetical protein
MTDTMTAPVSVTVAEFKPFVAVKNNRLLTIIGKTTQGNYMDRRGYLHRLEDLELDLYAYAERARADARDQAVAR